MMLHNGIRRLLVLVPYNRVAAVLLFVCCLHALPLTLLDTATAARGVHVRGYRLFFICHSRTQNIYDSSVPS